MDEDPTPGVCVGCGGGAATPADLVCEECARLLQEGDEGRMPATDGEARMVEVFRRALMVEHSDDWTMETVAEAAYICAAAWAQDGANSLP